MSSREGTPGILRGALHHLSAAILIMYGDQSADQVEGALFRRIRGP